MIIFSRGGRQFRLYPLTRRRVTLGQQLVFDRSKRYANWLIIELESMQKASFCTAEHLPLQTAAGQAFLCLTASQGFFGAGGQKILTAEGALLQAAGRVYLS